jgi:hypothetical protein
MDKLSKRRLAENEVIFRQINTEIKEFVLEDSADSAFADKPLRFYCECSNMDCRERIVMTAQEYERLHDDEMNFIVRPGHAMPEVENEVKKDGGYVVVKKMDLPPAPEDIDPKRFL